MGQMKEKKRFLLTDSGKIYVVELPEKKHYVIDDDGVERYRAALKQALTNKIEVHPDCVDEAKRLIAELLPKDKGGIGDTMQDQMVTMLSQMGFDLVRVKDNHPYLIEGLKVHLTTHLYEECQFECICSIEDTKQYAIISV